MSEPASGGADARTASHDELLRRLAEPRPSYIAEALENSDLTEEHVLIILRNRAATESSLTRIGSNPRWIRSCEVKTGLVRHPRTPRHMALNFVKHLRWRDLAGVADDPLLAPPLRRLAERILSERIVEMTQGEKITLARIAGRGIIRRMLGEKERLVVEAVLWNGRLIEPDLVAAVNDSGTPPGVLEIVASHPRWQGSYRLRLALARNPHTPRAVTIGVLTSLRAKDLAALADDPNTPTFIRQACARILSDKAWLRRRASLEE